MRKATIAAFVLASVLLGAASSGCTIFKNPAQDANNAVADANGHFRKYQTSSDAVAKFRTDLNALDPINKADNQQGIDAIAKIQTQFTEQRTQLGQASAALAKVKGFDVDAKVKKWATLEIAAVDAELAVVDSGVAYYTQMDRMFTTIRDKKDTPKLTAEILSSIEKATTKITEVTATASKAKDTADAYFATIDTKQ